MVNDYYHLQPYHHREYIYGGVHTSMSPVISSTSGYIPPYIPPTVSFNYGGYGGYQQPHYGGYQPQHVFGGYHYNNRWC